VDDDVNRPIDPRFMRNVIAQAAQAKAWHDNIREQYGASNVIRFPVERRADHIDACIRKCNQLLAAHRMTPTERFFAEHFPGSLPL
jgi:hypothetical protein